MKKQVVFIILLITIAKAAQSQAVYDSITISRFLINDQLLGKNWRDTLKAGHYSNYITEEKTVYRKPLKPPPRAMGVTPPFQALLDRIKKNGTADVANCFIPRHSVNYYKNGKIVKYLLVCFECDGLRFSDDPPKTFIKNAIHRETQMIELKKFFSHLL